MKKPVAIKRVAKTVAKSDKNVNRAIKVPESAIQKLRDGKTKSNNVKTYKGTKSAVMKEAMNRFYGKGWEGSAVKVKPNERTASKNNNNRFTKTVNGKVVRVQKNTRFGD